MTDWTNAPPPQTLYPGISLLRVPPDRPLEAVLLSNAILGTNTHWYRGRSIPCQGNACPCRHEPLPSRWHSYTCVANLDLSRRAVLELTALATLALQDILGKYGQLRGVRVKMFRRQKRPNGAIVVQASPDLVPAATLPEPIDVAAFMEAMWSTGQPTIPTQDLHPYRPHH